MRNMPVVFSPALESAYQADLADEKRRAFLHAGGLCVLLYTGFGVLDIWAISSAVMQAWMVRALVVGVTLACMAYAKWRCSAFLGCYQAIVCGLMALWGVGIEAIIALARPGEGAYTVYYAGLTLVTMALFTWTYVRPLYACILGAALAFSYLLLAVFWQRLDREPGATGLIANLFFLVSTNIIGLLSMFTRERFSRSAFLHKNALKHDLELQGEAQRQSLYLSEHDHLTALPNRLRFERIAAELFLQAAARGGAVGVLFIDLDDFKPVNDTHGHAAGDHVLACAARRIRSCIRASDVAARLGGDEFVVAIPLPAPDTDALERLRLLLAERLRQPVEYQGKPLLVGASIGVACFPPDGNTVAEVRAAADQRMYLSKRAGKAGRAAPVGDEVASGK